MCFFGHYDYYLFLQLRIITFIIDVLSAPMMILIAKIIIALLRDTKRVMLFTTAFADLVICMPLIDYLKDLLRSCVNFFSLTMAILDFFLYGLFLYVIDSLFLEKFKEPLKKKDEMIWKKIYAPAMISGFVIFFFYNIGICPYLH